MSIRRLPLEGVRVLDLSAAAAGALGAALLADMGAEVLKVAEPSAASAPEPPAYPQHADRNKYACVIDARHPQGRELILELARRSAVFVEDRGGDAMAELGLGYEELAAACPGIIYVTSPVHGNEDPSESSVGWAASRAGSVMGTFLAGAVVAALYHRYRTGRGQHIEVPQREALASFIGEYVVARGITGAPPPRAGNRHPLWSPHGCYPTAEDDGWIVIACRDDAEFHALCRAIGAPHLAADPRYATAAARKQDEDALDARISAWTRALAREEVFARCTAAGVPAAPVLSSTELPRDPHLQARGFWEPVSHATAGHSLVEGPAWRVRRVEPHVRIPPPRFGEHNDYVFRTLLGLDDARLVALREAGVIAEEPGFDVRH